MTEAVARRCAQPARDAARLAAAALRWVRRAVDIVLILLIAYMALAVLTQVAGRYLFNFSIAGAEETATFAQIWMVMLGAGYAMRKRMHVSIDILVARLPKPVAAAVMLPVAGLCMWFLWIVFDGSLDLIRIGAAQLSPALQISMEVPYAAMPVAAAYLAIETALMFIDRIAGRNAAAPSEAPAE